MTPGEIQKAVAKHYEVSINELRSETRIARIAQPRAVAMYLIRTLLGYSLPEIGRIFKRDHTTVLQAERKVTEQLGAGGPAAAKIKTVYAIIAGVMTSTPACCESCGRPLKEAA